VQRLLGRLSDETAQTMKLKAADRRAKSAIHRKPRGKK
jgi:hypothetical protein